MKKYENPMLQIVDISKNDIIVTSDVVGLSGEKKDPGLSDAPDRFREWDAGY